MPVRAAMFRVWSAITALAVSAGTMLGEVPDVWAAVGPERGTVAVVRTAQAEPRASSRPITKPPVIKPRPVICIGGRVTPRGCVCPAGWTAFRGGYNVSVCRKPTTKPDVECRGGRVVRGACVCPQDRRQSGNACLPRPDPPPPPRPQPVPPAPGKVVDPPAPSERTRPRLPALTPPGGATRIAPGPPEVAQGQAIGAADVVVPAEVVALAAAGAPVNVGGDVARDFGLELLQQTTVALTGDVLLRFRIPDSRDIQTVAAALAADARLEGPQPNFVYRPQQSSGPQRPPSDLQYALDKVDLADAHALAHGAGVLVAVIDSGVDANHPDLAGVVEAEVDVSGAGQQAGAPADPHGTAIAGIIAARGLVRGIAPAARILSLRAFRPGQSGAPATSTTAVLVVAMDRAMGQGAAILNLSFAGPSDPLLHRLVKAVGAKGGLIVAAAGNKGPDAPPVYPAGYAEVIAVTATDAADRIYGKANRGAYIAVAAPGVDVLAPGVAKSHQLQSGTSFAAALVSGILALMRERAPGLTLDDARLALMAAAVDLGVPGRDAEFGAGRVSAGRALKALDGPGR